MNQCSRQSFNHKLEWICLFHLVLCESAKDDFTNTFAKRDPDICEAAYEFICAQYSEYELYDQAEECLGRAILASLVSIVRHPRSKALWESVIKWMKGYGDHGLFLRLVQQKYLRRLKRQSEAARARGARWKPEYQLRNNEFQHSEFEIRSALNGVGLLYPNTRLFDQMGCGFWALKRTIPVHLRREPVTTGGVVGVAYEGTHDDNTYATKILPFVSQDAALYKDRQQESVEALQPDNAPTVFLPVPEDIPDIAFGPIPVPAQNRRLLPNPTCVDAAASPPHQSPDALVVTSKILHKALHHSRGGLVANCLAHSHLWALVDEDLRHSSKDAVHFEFINGTTIAPALAFTDTAQLFRHDLTVYLSVVLASGAVGSLNQYRYAFTVIPLPPIVLPARGALADAGGHLPMPKHPVLKIAGCIVAVTFVTACQCELKVVRSGDAIDVPKHARVAFPNAYVGIGVSYPEMFTVAEVRAAHAELRMIPATIDPRLRGVEYFIREGSPSHCPGPVSVWGLGDALMCQSSWNEPELKKSLRKLFSTDTKEQKNFAFHYLERFLRSADNAFRDRGKDGVAAQDPTETKSEPGVAGAPETARGDTRKDAADWDEVLGFNC